MVFLSVAAALAALCVDSDDVVKVLSVSAVLFALSLLALSMWHYDVLMMLNVFVFWVVGLLIKQYFKVKL
jgi:hypothetical protein